MINKIKRRKQLVALLLFLSVVLFSHGQDTIVKKRYLDSIKNQLAIYTVSSYTHLNLYDRAESERLRVQVELDKTKNTLDYVVWRRRRENFNYSISFLFLIGMSFFTITKFK